MGRILLIGNEWRLRALLRAQLIEESFEVEALETIEEATQCLAGSRPLPALVIADLSESEQPLGAIKKLGAWTSQVPVWLIASRTTLAEEAVQNRGFEKVFFRPVDLGELVQAIRERRQSPRG